MTLRAARTFSVGLLCVGDELLDGRVQESNGMVLMHQLRADHGLDLEALVVCRDEEEAIARRVLALSGVHDLVVVCGGLGPTEDDRTREALAAAADQELVYNQEAYERICHRFRARQKTPLPTHRKQALFPQSATVLWNEVGTAAGFCMRVGRSVWMSLPGVPGEFAWCLGAHLGEVLEAAGFEGSGTTWRRRLRFFGIGESALEQRLVGLGAWGGEVVVGYRAAWPELEVSLRGRDAKALEEACALVRSQAGQWLVGEGEEGVLEQVCALLQERGERVTCAESCTGGLLGGELTKQSGSSAWFGRGYITYANRAKQEMLGVSLGVLERWGAVSAQVVCQMALGARRASGETYALSISGVAGPGGGSEHKPVGTVYFGLSGPEGTWWTVRQWLGHSRQEVRQGAVCMALIFLLWELQGQLAGKPGMVGPCKDEQVWSPEGVNPEEQV